MLNFDPYKCLERIRQRAAFAEIDAAPIATPVAEVVITATPSDPDRLLDHIRLHGPTTYGAAAIALGWGATRAAQAEARLRADGWAQIEKDGRMHITDALDQFEERAAILEYEGGLSRQEAEAAAR